MLKSLLSIFSPSEKLFKRIRDNHYQNWEQELAHHKDIDSDKLRQFGLKIYDFMLSQYIKDHHFTEEEKAELQHIKDYFKLYIGETNSIHDKYAFNAISQLTKEKLADNILTDDEKKEIEEFSKELNVSNDDIERIYKKTALQLYEEALGKAIGDRNLSNEEEIELKKLANDLGIFHSDTGIDEKIKSEYNYLSLLNALNNGFIPQARTESTFVLQRNEVVYWESYCDLLITKNVTTGWEGRSQGFSIRVTKGLSYRVGSSRGNPIRADVTSTYPGIFAITNKRVVFSGSAKAFSIPYKSLIDFEPYSDGIGLQKTNAYYLVRFNAERVSEVIFKILTNVINKEMI